MCLERLRCPITPLNVCTSLLAGSIAERGCDWPSALQEPDVDNTPVQKLAVEGSWLVCACSMSMAERVSGEQLADHSTRTI